MDDIETKNATTRFPTLSESSKIEAVKREFFKRIHLYKGFSENMVIDSDDSYREADEKIVEGQYLKQGIKEKLDPIVKERNTAHKRATAFRASLVDPIEDGSKRLVVKMQIYKQNQRQRAAEEKKRLEEEAKKRQEDECLAQAAEMEANGADPKAIDGVLDFAEDLQSEIYVPTTVLRSKTSFTLDWKIEVVDEFLVPEEFIIRTVNEKAIKKIVQDKKGNIKIPGIKIIEGEKVKRLK